MNRRAFIRTLSMGAGAGFLSSCSRINPVPQSRPGQRPNLLFIFPDQFRIQALGIWRQQGYNKVLGTVSDPVITPNLNQLAKDGILFTQAPATHPVCSPYRAMLMSSMYPSRNGVMDVNCHAGRPQGLRHDITCLTDVLAAAGYDTAYIGKTHWERTEPLFDKEGNFVGTSQKPGGNYANLYDTYIPPGKGRHSNRYWFQSIKDSHNNAMTYSAMPELVGGKKDGDVYQSHRYTPAVEADVIVDYIKNDSNQRDARKPFSLFWAPNPPHPPYSKVTDCEESVYQKYYQDMPLDKMLNRPNLQPTEKNRSKISAPFYFSNVTSVDRQIGRVLQALAESGQADNTLVVFTSDHGEMMGSHGMMGKNQIYRESFTVPLIMRFPGRLKSRLEDLMIGPVDMMPTLLGLMGLHDSLPSTAQGVNYASGLLSGNFQSCPKPPTALYLNMNKKGVRGYRYCYQVDKEGKTLLIDHQADPYELNNLNPESIDSRDLAFLKKELGRWLQVAQDPWYENRLFNELIDYPD